MAQPVQPNTQGDQRPNQRTVQVFLTNFTLEIHLLRSTIRKTRQIMAVYILGLKKSVLSEIRIRLLLEKARQIMVV